MQRMCTRPSPAVKLLPRWWMLKQRGSPSSQYGDWYRMKPRAMLALMLCVLPILFTGCAAATPAPEPVTLQFIGNSCTLITAPDGTRIVSDPYGNSEHPTGLRALPKDLEADAITVSHAHPDHNNVEGVGGTPQRITVPGAFQVGMVNVTGYAGYEGSPLGPSANPHVVFVFEIGGVKIVHLGDSGPITQPDVLAAIENADVLLASIDGYVIPSNQLMPFLRQAKVRTFVPTHYSLSTSARWQGALAIDEFIRTLPTDLAVVRQGREIQVTPNMPQQMVELTPLALTE